MKLFISWSGSLSHGVARILREWLPVVLPSVVPWVSSEDIPKGHRWGAELANELEGTDCGIICVVPGNLDEPWLNFEAGALSKSVKNARVHPFLLGLPPGDLSEPLRQFQITCFDKDDLHRLVRDLNQESSEAIPNDVVDRNFEICWPDLDRRLSALLPEAVLARTDPTAPDRDFALTDEDVKVLNLMLKLQKRAIRAEDIAAPLVIETERARYLLERLEEAGFLDGSNDILDRMYGKSWDISRDGRARLVGLGLL